MNNESAKLIDGKAIAADIRERVREGVMTLRRANKTVSLTAVLVGGAEAARVYAANQAKTCNEAGIEYRLVEMPAGTSQHELHSQLAALERDAQVTGIMLHLPLPAGLNAQQAQFAIDVIKDVEGVNPSNIGHLLYGHPIISPCTASAAVALIESTGVPLRGAEVTVVGASRIAGRPTALLLTERGATVTVCQIDTRDVAAHCRRADILVVAVGKEALIRGQDIKPGAVVIDVGINRRTKTTPDGQIISRIVGDVDFESARKVAGWITPVPGGVGPVTVAMLLSNTLRAARLAHGWDNIW